MPRTAANTDERFLIKVKDLVSKSNDQTHKLEEMNQLLVEAVQRGSIEAIELLIKNGADVNYTSGGHSLLYFAMENGHIETMKLLLNNHAGTTLGSTNAYYNAMVECLLLGGLGGPDQYWSAHAREFDRRTDVPRVENYCKEYAVDQGEFRKFRSGGGNLNDISYMDIVVHNWHIEMYEENIFHKTLQYAVLNGHVDVASYLIDNGASCSQTVSADLSEEVSDGASLLSVATQGGHYDLACSLIARGCDVNHKDSDENTPLFYAILHDDTEMAYPLIDNGANIYDVNQDGETLLNMASLNGSVEILEYLLAERKVEHNASVDLLHSAIDQGNYTVVLTLLDNLPHLLQEDMGEGRSPLHFAAEKGCCDIVKLLVELLIERGADVWQADSDGYTPLVRAAVNQHADVVSILINHGASFPDNLNNYGIPDSLWFGIVKYCRGDVGSVKLLIASGIDLDQEKDSDGCTALFIAAQNGHVEAMERLIDSGADINKADKSDCTPLFVAAEMGHVEAMELLIDSGADINQANYDGITPYNIAKKNGQQKAMEMLILRHADTSNADNDGSTPYDVAIENGNAEAGELLLRHTPIANQNEDVEQIKKQLFDEISKEKPNFQIFRSLADPASRMSSWKSIINSADDDGSTLLMFAVQHKNTKFLEYLITNGADVNATNTEGSTALGQAVLARNKQSVKVLLYHNANIDAQCNQGYTVLMAAVLDENLAVTKHLVKKGANTALINNLYQTVFDLETTDEIKKLLSHLQRPQSDSVEPWLEEDSTIYTDRQDGAVDVDYAALFDAVRRGRDSEVDALLADPAFDINYQRLGDRASLLMVAAENNQVQLVETLLGKGLDSSLKDVNEKTAWDRISNLTPRARTNIDGVIVACLQSTRAESTQSNSTNESFIDDRGEEETKDSEPNSNSTDTPNNELDELNPQDLTIFLNDGGDTHGADGLALNGSDYAGDSFKQSIHSSYVPRWLLEVLVGERLTHDFQPNHAKFLSGHSRGVTNKSPVQLTENCEMSCLTKSQFQADDEGLQWLKKVGINNDGFFHGTWYSNYDGNPGDYKPTFVMSGRFPDDIHVPSYDDDHDDQSYRTVLVLTSQQYDNHFIGGSVIADNRLDVLVIDFLNYILPLDETDDLQAELGSISCRRMAIFFMMHALEFTSCVMMDDNVSEIQFSIDNVGQLLEDESCDIQHYSDLYQTLSKALTHDASHKYHSVALSGNRSYLAFNDSAPQSFINHGRLGSKFFFLDIQEIRKKVLVEQVRFLCPMVNVFGEDYHMIYFFEALGLQCGALDRRVFARSRAPKMGSICAKALAGVEWFHQDKGDFDNKINTMLDGVSREMKELLDSTIGKLWGTSIQSLKQITSQIKTMQRQELVLDEHNPSSRDNICLSEALLQADDEIAQRFLTPEFSQRFANSLSQAIDRGDYNPLIVSPTGTGKSVWISSMLSALYANYSYKDDQSRADGKFTQFLLCVPTIALVEDSFDRLVSFYSHMKDHVVKSSSRDTHASANEIALNKHLRNKDRSHVVIMCQKSVKILKSKLASIELFLEDIFDVIIVDEVHMATAPLTQISCSSTSREVSRPLVLGLTATPTDLVHNCYRKVLEITQDQALKARIIRRKEIIPIETTSNVVAMAANIVVNTFIRKSYKAIIFCNTIKGAESVLNEVKRKMGEEENSTEDQCVCSNVHSSLNNMCIENEEEKRELMVEEENVIEDQSDLFLKALHSNVSDNLHDSIIKTFTDKQSRAILFLVRMGAVGMNFGFIDAVLDLHIPSGKNSIGFTQRWGRALRIHPLVRCLLDFKRMLNGSNDLDIEQTQKTCTEMLELCHNSCTHSISKNLHCIQEITEKIMDYVWCTFDYELESLLDEINACIDTLSPPTEIYTYKDDINDCIDTLSPPTEIHTYRRKEKSKTPRIQFFEGSNKDTKEEEDLQFTDEEDNTEDTEENEYLDLQPPVKRHRPPSQNENISASLLL